MIAYAAIPNRIANRNVQIVSTLTFFTLLFVCVAVLANSALLMANENGLQLSWLSFVAGGNFLSVYFDALSATVALLISFVGLVIVRYSNRYLDGDANQGKFFKWISFTLGAVLLMVLTGNLLVFGLMWMLTSLGLHQLLTFYGDRKKGVDAAWKKFAISRFGDAMVLIAIAIVYVDLGSENYQTIFALATTADPDSSTGGSVIGSIVAVLLVIAAISKSAQFPLHAWLPETMESPTPVSALMHAGIINGGGFLVIRFSPLIVQAPMAMHLLAVVGGFTAVFAAVVAMAQGSVKRSLAYSTISQMGFMMLQCGLGAFSAALLHIVAHSLYKSYAFLNAGSVVQNLPGFQLTPATQSMPFSIARTIGWYVSGLLIATGIVGSSLWIFGLFGKVTGGSFLLVVILVLALSQLLVNAFAHGKVQIAVRGLLSAVLVSNAYCLAFLCFQLLLSTTDVRTVGSISQFSYVLMVLFSVAFGVLLVVSNLLLAGTAPQWMKGIYVHAANGFYIDVVYDIVAQKVRTIAGKVKRRTQTPRV